MLILGWMLVYLHWIVLAIGLYTIYRLFSWLASKGL